ncbi:hypothetical protein ACHAWU_007394 [Discostella pseudostelligera]|uniref:Serine/threonine protein kinase n=1 Tax=Discostella pseudostelligera TaxID=259834 RepID=A0ABD3MBF4_9STRA
MKKKPLHNEIENSATTTPKSIAVQHSRFHESSSPAIATIQIKTKAIHNASDNSRTVTTSKSNAIQHSHHVECSRLHDSSSSAMATQIKKKATHKECANGMPTTTPTPTSSRVRCHYQPTTAPCHPITSSSSSYNNNNNNNTIDPNTERLLRFHEAYNAIIRATTLPNNEGGRSTISARWLQSGGKRWTRDPNIVSAVSIDGRVYEDLQRTPTLSLKQMRGSSGTAMAPILYDRAASWFTMATPPKHPSHTNNHDGEYGKQNGNNGGEEGETAIHLSHLILQGARNYQQRKVLIRQFSIDCRTISAQQHADAKIGGHVSISTLQLIFTGGRHAIASKPRHGKARRKNSNHRRRTFDKKLQDSGTIADETPVNGSRRTFTKKLSNTKAELNNAVAAEISIASTKQIVSPVSNLEVMVEEELLSSPPPSQDRFNVIDYFKESLLYHLSESSIIDTDGTEIDILEDGNDFYDDTHNNSATATTTTTTTASSTARIQSMSMSPSLITKRYQQALKAIEHRNWKQISHMINANPWLMEMKDVRNDQNLVHTLAFFGGELNNIGHESSNTTTTNLPEQLVRDIIEYEPSAVHKLDIEGNLPLHMAAASGNVIMIEELGRRFPGAASVQNHYGLLPLHLAVISYQDLLATTTTCTISSVEFLLELFPGAVGVKDNDGNLPLHTAASALRGVDGARVVNLLLKAYHNWSMATVRVNNNPPPAVGMCKNNAGETPLTRAIQSLAGKDMIEALLQGDGGRLAALDKDSESRIALHLALDRNFHDASVVLSILKASPSTATIVDGDGMLPIQLACRNSLQHEVILAISIIDLPIDLGAVNGDAVLREGFGASWWYLLCESNDEYVGVVQDILSLCSYPQKVALCLAKKLGGIDKEDGSRSRTVVSCATPRCEQELRKRCLFWNRFEIVGEATTKSHAWNVQKFDAIDHGGTEYDDPIVPNGGKRVSLFCYTDSKAYRKDVEHLILHNRTLDSKQFEELNHLAKERDDGDGVDDVGDDSPPHGISYQYCVATDDPRKTLANVIAQMADYDRMKYLRKSRHLLHGISKSLHTMHTNNIIHGCIDSTTIGKFGSTTWKITGLIGSVVAGDHFPASRLGLHSPPEAFVVMRDKIDHERKFASVAQSLVAEPTVDVWAFGKLLYEVLAGESLFRLFLQKKMQNNKYHHEDASKCILKWSDDRHLPKVTKKLLSIGISTNGVELISKCLCGKDIRAISMKEVVDHPFWDGF